MLKVASQHFNVQYDGYSFWDLLKTTFKIVIVVLNMLLKIYFKWTLYLHVKIGKMSMNN